MKIGFLVAAAFLGACVGLRATTVTFEDLPTLPTGVINGGNSSALYSGLQWSDDFKYMNVGMIDPALLVGKPGYVNGATSGSVVAYNALDAKVSVGGGLKFFKGANFTASRDEKTELRIEGWSGGKLVHLYENTLSALAPLYVNLGWTVDSLKIETPVGPQFVMDDLSYSDVPALVRTSVPDSGSTLVMLALSGLGFAGLRRRRS